MAVTELPTGLAGAASSRAEASARLRAAVAAARSFALGFPGRCCEWSKAEAGRIALWAPVAIGAGVVLYFSLKAEPPAWLGAAMVLAAGAARTLGRDRWRIAASAALLLAIGFAAADWRAASVDAPILVREMTPKTLTGRLIAVDEAPKARRLTIEVATIDGVEAAALPKRVRVSWRGKDFDALPGDSISLRAGLAPPPAPAAPGGLDYARQLYFMRIGAVGYAVVPPQKIGGPTLSLLEKVSAAIERARLKITRRILDAAPGQGGAIVAASVTGHRGAINDETEAALRDSGLAHLVAISGLNMALATGLIFFAVRGGLALIEPVALRYPIKKWAAIAALLSGFIYLLLSGGEWSALRAFIMTAIVFVAILFDRRALSLRNVAIAATIIVLIAPEAVMHPGFQMSFAAVVALVAFYEWSSARADPARSFTVFARVRRYIVAIAVTDMIAASATAPFSLYHFNQSANYGLPANVIAIPIMGFAVMPLAVVGLVLMPFGLDAWAWRGAAMGVDVIVAVGGAVASLPGAVITIVQWPPAALGVLVLGGLWLCLQSAPWRLGGLAALPLAAVLIALTPAPSIFVTGKGDNAGIVVAEDGGRALFLFNPRKDKFSASVWKEQAGLDQEKAPTGAMSGLGRCDPSGCTATAEGVRIAMSADPLELAEDCRRADLVVAFYPVAARVKTACVARLIDRRAVWEGGAQAVWIKSGEVRVRTVAEIRGARPWSLLGRSAPHRNDNRKVVGAVERTEDD